MTGELRLRTAPSDELPPEHVTELIAQCEAAFREPCDEAWAQVGPGIHVIGELAGRAVAHAMIIDRPLYVGDEIANAIDAGYVELVATVPSQQRRGFGSRVMGEIGHIIRDEYALGALATGSQGFYARLGWEAWLGPTFVRMPDGERIRSGDEDHHVMVLRTPTTSPSVDISEPIACGWRPGEPW